MSRVIWKFRLEPIEPTQIPEGCRVLHVGVAQNQPSVWVLCDPTAPLTPRLQVCPTGAEVRGGVYVGTFKLDYAIPDHDEIYHVFDHGSDLLDDAEGQGRR